MRVAVEVIKPAIGGIVRVAKSDLLTDDVVEAIREALEDRSVLVFPRINLTDAEQLAFTDKLGKRVNFTRNIPGGSAAEQDVYKITLDADINTRPEYVLGTFFWHIDGVTIDQPLPKATLLTARKLSATGGQTEFASTYAAYENLPEAERAAIANLQVLHTLAASFRPLMDEAIEDLNPRSDTAGQMVHPLVWTHASGRKSLVIGTHADRVIGEGLAEGRSRLVRLSEWAAQPDFSYRHEWQQGDMVLWDNCGCMHRVVPYARDSGRTMHRTTIAGDEKVS